MVTAIIEDIKRNSTLDPNILECWYNVLRKYKTQIGDYMRISGCVCDLKKISENNSCHCIKNVVQVRLQEETG